MRVSEKRCNFVGECVFGLQKRTIILTIINENLLFRTSIFKNCANMFVTIPARVKDESSYRPIYPFLGRGVASAGRDGAAGSQIGTIDFVYDYGDKIVTVKESSQTDAEGNEDYSNYYSSFCLMYFDTNKRAADYTEAKPSFVAKLFFE